MSDTGGTSANNNIGPMEGSWSTATSKRKGGSPGRDQHPAKQRTLTECWTGAPASILTRNPFEVLTDNDKGDNPNLKNQNLTKNGETSKDTNPPKDPNPPPLFIQNVSDIRPLESLLNDQIGKDYRFKILYGNEVRLQLFNQDNYRKVLALLKERKTEFHTYKFKKDKDFRVVLKGLHHSTLENDIKSALESNGHTVTNIWNVKHRKSKDPLPMFFINLKTQANNKEIFKVTRFLNTVVEFQPPNMKKVIPQCTNCQRFNHTKAFCNRIARCVKCLGNHHTNQCTRKDKDNMVKCVNCGESHPANYRGCSVHVQLRKKIFPSGIGSRRGVRAETDSEPVIMDNTNNAAVIPPGFRTTRPSVGVTGGASYAGVLRGVCNGELSIDDGSDDVVSRDSSDSLEELKTMMKSLMNQMGTLLNLLTTVVARMPVQN
ncbi:uncharacterized protein DMENIID0001_104900 [Sergentomyia squamirostris]